MLISLLKIIFGLIGLSLIVIIHEGGHMLMAKKVGVVVEAFSVGWGKILYRKKRGGTEYRVSLFPLGGYCKLKGEQALIQAWESKAKSVETEPGDMYHASWVQRILISLAGPVANLIFAFILFFLIGFIGYKIHYYPPKIICASDFQQDKIFAADKGGLQTGDIILFIDKTKIIGFDQVQEIIMVHPDKALDFIVEREGRRINLTITPALNKERGSGYIGIYPWIPPIIKSLKEDSILNSYNIEPGSSIKAINGHSVNNTVDISDILQKEAILSVKIESPNKELKGINFKTSPKELGIAFDYLTRRTPPFSLSNGFKEGFTKTKQTISNTLMGFTLLFKGINLQEAVSGPLRITYLTGDLAFSGFQAGIGQGFLIFAQFLALINIALFIMNLLPIPVLDGGQILLFLIEGIFKKKPSPKVIYNYQIVGTVIVFALIIFATGNDILFFSRN